MKNISCVILAAGKGTRMKSSVPKPLHKIYSKSMLNYMCEAVEAVGIKDISIVVSSESEEEIAKTVDHKLLVQEKALGSANAILCAKDSLKNKKTDTVLLLYSDTPLITVETLGHLVKSHYEKKAVCTLLTTEVQDPEGYGRILRDEQGEIAKIVEEKDATLYEEVIKEINVGAYCFDKNILFDDLEKIKINPKKEEFYLTDIFDIFNKTGQKINSFVSSNPEECLGINSRNDLAQATSILKKRILSAVMDSGVTLIDPATTHIDFDVEIGKDTVVLPSTIIDSNVKIGKSCKIGPFAHLRSGTEIGNDTEVGNFVELVRTSVGEGCKIKHKTYLGDAVLGNNINIGAGTITANYDGKSKNKTIIEDNAFIGVGSILIAPVKIGKNATVGAGSVVTKKHDVPEGETVAGIPARVMKRKH